MDAGTLMRLLNDAGNDWRAAVPREARVVAVDDVDVFDTVELNGHTLYRRETLADGMYWVIMGTSPTAMAGRYRADVRMVSAAGGFEPDPLILDAQGHVLAVGMVVGLLDTYHDHPANVGKGIGTVIHMYGPGNDWYGFPMVDWVGGRKHHVPNRVLFRVVLPEPERDDRTMELRGIAEAAELAVEDNDLPEGFRTYALGVADLARWLANGGDRSSDLERVIEGDE